LKQLFGGRPFRGIGQPSSLFIKFVFHFSPTNPQKKCPLRPVNFIFFGFLDVFWGFLDPFENRAKTRSWRSLDASSDAPGNRQKRGFRGTPPKRASLRTTSWNTILKAENKISQVARSLRILCRISCLTGPLSLKGSLWRPGPPIVLELLVGVARHFGDPGCHLIRIVSWRRQEISADDGKDDILETCCTLKRTPLSPNLSPDAFWPKMAFLCSC